jgi:hypothetical protein
MGWPGAVNVEDDEDIIYIYVDHRDEEVGIVAAVSDRLAPDDILTSRTTDDGGLYVTHRGHEVLIPLTLTRHDRYVAISSLAVLLGEHYRFFIETGSLDSDTHAVFVVQASDAREWGAPPEHLEPLVLGVDYFSGHPLSEHAVKIPYLGHVEEGFTQAADAHAQARESAGAVMDDMLGMLLGGELDDSKLREIARHMAKDPSANSELGGMSEDEIISELRAGLGQISKDPDLTLARDGLAQLRSLTSGVAPSAKPWWNFW